MFAVLAVFIMSFPARFSEALLVGRLTWWAACAMQLASSPSAPPSSSTSAFRAAEKLYKRDGRQQHSTCVLTDEQREGLLDVDE